MFMLLNYNRTYLKKSKAFSAGWKWLFLSVLEKRKTSREFIPNELAAVDSMPLTLEFWQG